ncbi:hypothetical protein DFJ73DRAFT_849820 [Zopfochytrium polystomum]|nr:hypothetical protein DFJ73DRAFT_849820 [Zopfochytrium polystomum]
MSNYHQAESSSSPPSTPPRTVEASPTSSLLNLSPENRSLSSNSTIRPSTSPLASSSSPKSGKLAFGKGESKSSKQSPPTAWPKVRDLVRSLEKKKGDEESQQPLSPPRNNTLKAFLSNSMSRSGSNSGTVSAGVPSSPLSPASPSSLSNRVPSMASSPTIKPAAKPAARPAAFIAPPIMSRTASNTSSQSYSSARSESPARTAYPLTPAAGRPMSPPRSVAPNGVVGHRYSPSSSPSSIGSDPSRSCSPARTAYPLTPAAAIPLARTMSPPRTQSVAAPVTHHPNATVLPIRTASMAGNQPAYGGSLLLSSRALSPPRVALPLTAAAISPPKPAPPVMTNSSVNNGPFVQQAFGTSSSGNLETSPQSLLSETSESGSLAKDLTRRLSQVLESSVSSDPSVRLASTTSNFSATTALSPTAPSFVERSVASGSPLPSLWGRRESFQSSVVSNSSTEAYSTNVRRLSSASTAFTSPTPQPSVSPLPHPPKDATRSGSNGSESSVDLVMDSMTSYESGSTVSGVTAYISRPNSAAAIHRTTASPTPSRSLSLQVEPHANSRPSTPDRLTRGESRSGAIFSTSTVVQQLQDLSDDDPDNDAVPWRRSLPPRRDSVSSVSSISSRASISRYVRPSTPPVKEPSSRHSISSNRSNRSKRGARSHRRGSLHQSSNSSLRSEYIASELPASQIRGATALPPVPTVSVSDEEAETISLADLERMDREHQRSGVWSINGEVLFSDSSDESAHVHSSAPAPYRPPAALHPLSPPAKKTQHTALPARSVSMTLSQLMEMEDGLGDDPAAFAADDDAEVVSLADLESLKEEIWREERRASFSAASVASVEVAVDGDAPSVIEYKTGIAKEEERGRSRKPSVASSRRSFGSASEKRSSLALSTVEMTPVAANKEPSVISSRSAVQEQSDSLTANLVPVSAGLSDPSLESSPSTPVTASPSSTFFDKATPSPKSSLAKPSHHDKKANTSPSQAPPSSNRLSGWLSSTLQKMGAGLRLGNNGNSGSGNSSSGSVSPSAGGSLLSSRSKSQAALTIGTQGEKDPVASPPAMKISLSQRSWRKKKSAGPAQTSASSVSDSAEISVPIEQESPPPVSVFHSTTSPPISPPSSSRSKETALASLSPAVSKDSVSDPVVSSDSEEESELTELLPKRTLVPSSTPMVSVLKNLYGIGKDKESAPLLGDFEELEKGEGASSAVLKDLEPPVSPNDGLSSSDDLTTRSGSTENIDASFTEDEFTAFVSHTSEVSAGESSVKDEAPKGSEPLTQNARAISGVVDAPKTSSDRSDVPSGAEALLFEGRDEPTPEDFVPKCSQSPEPIAVALDAQSPLAASNCDARKSASRLALRADSAIDTNSPAFAPSNLVAEPQSMDTISPMLNGQGAEHKTTATVLKSKVQLLRKSYPSERSASISVSKPETAVVSMERGPSVISAKLQLLRSVVQPAANPSVLHQPTVASPVYNSQSAPLPPPLQPETVASVSVVKTRMHLNRSRSVPVPAPASFDEVKSEKPDDAEAIGNSAVSSVKTVKAHIQLIRSPSVLDVAKIESTGNPVADPSPEVVRKVDVVAPKTTTLLKANVKLVGKRERAKSLPSEANARPNVVELLVKVPAKQVDVSIEKQAAEAIEANQAVDSLPSCMAVLPNSTEPIINSAIASEESADVEQSATVNSKLDTARTTVFHSRLQLVRSMSVPLSGSSDQRVPAVTDIPIKPFIALPKDRMLPNETASSATIAASSEPVPSEVRPIVRIIPVLRRLSSPQVVAPVQPGPKNERPAPDSSKTTSVVKARLQLRRSKSMPLPTAVSGRPIAMDQGDLQSGEASPKAETINSRIVVDVQRRPLDSAMGKGETSSADTNQTTATSEAAAQPPEPRRVIRIIPVMRRLSTPTPSKPAEPIRRPVVLASPDTQRSRPATPEEEDAEDDAALEELQRSIRNQSILLPFRRRLSIVRRPKVEPILESVGGLEEVSEDEFDSEEYVDDNPLDETDELPIDEDLSARHCSAGSEHSRNNTGNGNICRSEFSDDQEDIGEILPSIIVTNDAQEVVERSCEVRGGGSAWKQVHSEGVATQTGTEIANTDEAVTEESKQPTDLSEKALAMQSQSEIVSTAEVEYDVSKTLPDVDSSMLCERTHAELGEEMPRGDTFVPSVSENVSDVLELRQREPAHTSPPAAQISAHVDDTKGQAADAQSHVQIPPANASHLTSNIPRSDVALDRLGAHDVLEIPPVTARESLEILESCYSAQISSCDAQSAPTCDEAKVILDADIEVLVPPTINQSTAGTPKLHESLNSSRKNVSEAKEVLLESGTIISDSETAEPAQFFDKDILSSELGQLPDDITPPLSAEFAETPSSVEADSVPAEIHTFDSIADRSASEMVDLKDKPEDPWISLGVETKSSPDEGAVVIDESDSSLSATLKDQIDWTAKVNGAIAVDGSNCHYTGAESIEELATVSGSACSTSPQDGTKSVQIDSQPNFVAAGPLETRVKVRVRSITPTATPRLPPSTPGPAQRPNTVLIIKIASKPEPSPRRPSIVSIESQAVAALQHPLLTTKILDNAHVGELRREVSPDIKALSPIVSMDTLQDVPNPKADEGSVLEGKESCRSGPAMRPRRRRASSAAEYGTVWLRDLSLFVFVLYVLQQILWGFAGACLTLLPQTFDPLWVGHTIVALVLGFSFWSSLQPKNLTNC